LLKNFSLPVFHAAGQTWMDREMMRVTEGWMMNPTVIRVVRDEMYQENLAQYFIDVEEKENKLEILKQLLEHLHIAQVSTKL